MENRGVGAAELIILILLGIFLFGACMAAGANLGV